MESVQRNLLKAKKIGVIKVVYSLIANLCFLAPHKKLGYKLS